STLEEDDLRQTYGKSLGEALEHITGVNTLSTGATIQKPMIHGLHSNRLVILNNGVRLESQRWGAEHAPEMDPFLAKQLSVVKGAAGVQYGAEAIGGVVIANPSTLPLASPWQGEMHLIGMSNGRQGVFSATLEKGSQKIKGLGWRLQGTLKRGGDLQAADYSLTNTAHSEANFSVGVGWQNARWQTEIFYSYFSTTLGILRSAHIGNLDNLESAINRQEPFVTEDFSYDINNPKQEVVHHLGKVHLQRTLKENLTLSAQYSFQFNRRSEFDIRRGGRSNIPALDLSLATQALDLDLAHKLGKNWQGGVGLNLSLQDNENIPGTGVRPIVPNYDRFTQGIYWYERFIGKRFDLEAGIRYDYQYLEVATFINRTELVKPDYQFSNTSFTLGGTYYWSKYLTLQTNLTRAWRPPNISELFSQGLHHGSGIIEEGLLYENGQLNLEINPENEQAYKWINTLTYQDTRFILEASAYYNYIRNFIFLSPFDTRLTIRGAFPVFTYQQTDADFFGLDINGQYEVYKNFSSRSKVSLLYARDIVRDDVIIHMPPYRFDQSFTYQPNRLGKIKKPYFTLQSIYTARQFRAPRVVPISEVTGLTNQQVSDIQAEGVYDFIGPPSDYWLFNWQMGGEFSLSEEQSLQVGFSVENVFNIAYRDYLNRFRYYADDLGRNFIIRLQYNF
ncbi:MAG: TonB-dependent receptor, partial [Bacteroidota bacterium]